MHCPQGLSALLLFAFPAIRSSMLGCTAGKQKAPQLLLRGDAL